MANELVNATGEVVEAKSFNKNLGNRVIQISIKCRKIKKADGKGTFNSVKGLKYLTVIDEEGVNIGKHNRWLDVHFKRDAFKNIPSECEVTSPEDLKTGFLYVKASAVQSPRTYVVKEDEETGELKYPCIWIQENGIVGFEPYVSSQDEFTYHEADKSIVEVEEDFEQYDEESLEDAENLE